MPLRVSGKRPSQTRRLNTGQGRNALDEAAVKLAPMIIVVAAQEWIEGSKHDPFGIKAWIGVVRSDRDAAIAASPAALGTALVAARRDPPHEGIL